MQMASIYLIKREMLPINNSIIQYVLYLIIIWTISILGGYYLNIIWSDFIYGKKNVQKDNRLHS